MREMALVFIVANLLLALWGVWIKPDPNVGSAAELPAAATRLALTDMPPIAQAPGATETPDVVQAQTAPDAVPPGQIQIGSALESASHADGDLVQAVLSPSDDALTDSSAADALAESSAATTEPVIIPAAGFTEALPPAQSADERAGQASTLAPDAGGLEATADVPSEGSDAARIAQITPAEDSAADSEQVPSANTAPEAGAQTSALDEPSGTQAPEAEAGGLSDVEAIEPVALAQGPDNNALSDDVGAAPLEGDAQIQAAPGVRCRSVGPFLDLPEAADAAGKLRDAGYSPAQHLLESEIWIGHWVLLPPLGSREEAIEVVERLRGLGVNDLYIEPAGAVRNGISLGLFSELTHAETRVATIRQHGYEPVVRDRSRTADVYWIDINSADPIDLNDFEFNPNRNISIEYGLCSEPN